MIYLHFLRSLAFKMFEQNELTLRRGSLQIPDLRFQGGYISVLEFPIKHLFENTGSSIEFIHKSIYEYFAAEYIIEALYENINKDKEHFAGVLGNLFKENKLTKEIIEFAKYKIRINSLLHDSFGVVYDAFHLMLENGMTFYTDKHKKIIGYEMKLFANMLEVLHFWDGIHLELNDMMCNYIEYNRNNFLNLSSCSVGENNVADLKGASCIIQV